MWYNPSISSVLTYAEKEDTLLGWMDENGDLINDYEELNEDRGFTAKYVSE